MRNFFAHSKEGKTRMVKVVLNDKEELILDVHKNVHSAQWNADYNEFVLKVIEPTKPCFIFYRLDEKNKAGQHMWLFISWSPDCVSNKQRTIYALCKSSLINKFSGGQIKENLFIF